MKNSFEQDSANRQSTDSPITFVRKTESRALGPESSGIGLPDGPGQDQRPGIALMDLENQLSKVTAYGRPNLRRTNLGQQRSQRQKIERQNLEPQIIDHQNGAPIEPTLGERLSDQHSMAVTSLDVRRVRKNLGLTVDHFALLVGVSPSSVFRYENIGVSAFHHGPVARKLCLLTGWTKTEGQVTALRTMLTADSGLAILAGLLEAGNVLTIGLSFDDFVALGQMGQEGQEGQIDRPAVGLPTVESLADSFLRAFRHPSAPIVEESPEPPIYQEDFADRMEAEARVMEAEARKLEAQARKLEAMARIKSAEGIVNQ